MRHRPGIIEHESDFRGIDGYPGLGDRADRHGLDSDQTKHKGLHRRLTRIGHGLDVVFRRDRQRAIEPRSVENRIGDIGIERLISGRLLCRQRSRGIERARNGCAVGCVLQMRARIHDIAEIDATTDGHRDRQHRQGGNDGDVASCLRPKPLEHVAQGGHGRCSGTGWRVILRSNLRAHA